MILRKCFIFLALYIVASFNIKAQLTDTTQVMDYSSSKQYTIDTIIVIGTQTMDANILASFSGYVPGAKINMPGDDILKMIKKYWDYGLFEDVKITSVLKPDNHVDLKIYLKERPRLSRFNITGVKKGDIEDLKEKLKLRAGSQVNENIINNSVNIIKKFYIEKGYFNALVKVDQQSDTSLGVNRVKLTFDITKGKRVKIKDIVFTGNDALSASKLRKNMKKTRRRDWKFWNSSKYIENDYKEDKTALIDLYNEKGFRDAKILSDSIKVVSPKRILIYINLYEGKKYYVRNITWIGNTKYPSEYLSGILGIRKGDVFDQKLFDKRISTDEDAVSSVYLDNGYLFFSCEPTEIKIDNDSIDFEMRIFEGKQATINNILIAGNSKTNEHVARREIRTIPGELFSKSDIIRSVRELANLGHFEPEKIEPVPIPNPSNGTVDIKYNLTERANDQLEISGGYGMNMFIGTVGIRFNNFSIRNFFKWSEWRPVPSGDGQSLSLRFQSNGTYYQTLNMSFSDPWFGGKKPNAFSLSMFYSKQTEGSGYGYTFTSSNYMTILGGSVGLGKRLKWPDDYFTLHNEVSYEAYILHNYNSLFRDGKSKYGTMNNLSFATTLSRNSVDQLIYPRSGSAFSIRCQFTLPYSLLTNKKYDDEMPQIDRYKWVEYHKWSFKAETYNTLVGNLVLATKAQFGFLGRYKTEVGFSPFDRYSMGGSGMNYSYYGTNEYIALRGYPDASVTPYVDKNGNPVDPTKTGSVVNGESSGIQQKGNIYDKFSLELRYPVTLKEQAAIYGLVFADAGNAWYDFTNSDPLNLKRSAGFGVRVFLPMFGMLGFDFGYRLDDVPYYGKHAWETHFILGQNF